MQTDLFGGGKRHKVNTQIIVIVVMSTEEKQEGPVSRRSIKCTGDVFTV